MDESASLVGRFVVRIRRGVPPRSSHRILLIDGQVPAVVRTVGERVVFKQAAPRGPDGVYPGTQLGARAA